MVESGEQPLHAEDLNLRFGRNVRRARESAGLTHAALAVQVSSRSAGAIALSTTAVTDIEDGTRPARLDEAAVIAEIVQVPLADLITDGAPASDPQQTADEALKRRQRDDVIAEFESFAARLQRANEAWLKANAEEHDEQSDPTDRPR